MIRITARRRHSIEVNRIRLSLSVTYAVAMATVTASSVLRLLTVVLFVLLSFVSNVSSLPHYVLPQFVCSHACLSVCLSAEFLNK